MLNKLKEIKEALEFIQERTPNFTIEHKAAMAIPRLDAVMKKCRQMQKMLPDIKDAIDGAISFWSEDSRLESEVKKFENLLTKIQGWENE